MRAMRGVDIAEEGFFWQWVGARGRFPDGIILWLMVTRGWGTPWWCWFTHNTNENKILQKIKRIAIKFENHRIYQCRFFMFCLLNQVLLENLLRRWLASRCFITNTRKLALSYIIYLFIFIINYFGKDGASTKILVFYLRLVMTGKKCHHFLLHVGIWIAQAQYASRCL